MADEAQGVHGVPVDGDVHLHQVRSLGLGGAVVEARVPGRNRLGLPMYAARPGSRFKPYSRKVAKAWGRVAGVLVRFVFGSVSRGSTVLVLDGGVFVDISVGWSTHALAWTHLFQARAMCLIGWASVGVHSWGMNTSKLRGNDSWTSEPSQTGAPPGRGDHSRLPATVACTPARPVHHPGT